MLGGGHPHFGDSPPPRGRPHDPKPQPRVPDVTSPHIPPYNPKDPYGIEAKRRKPPPGFMDHFAPLPAAGGECGACGASGVSGVCGVRMSGHQWGVGVSGCCGAVVGVLLGHQWGVFGVLLGCWGAVGCQGAVGLLWGAVGAVRVLGCRGAVGCWGVRMSGH